jgi:anti-sigma factor RsiW
MKQEILDRLLIDRALDALSPEVAALLDEHLEKEPQHMHASQEINNTVRLAKLALARRQEMSLPPLKLLLLPEKAPLRVDPRHTWRLAELAAALILGIGLGLWAFRPGEPAVSKPEANRVGVTREVFDPAPSFWSMKRLASIGSRPSSLQAPRLTWRSPAQNPQAND